MGEGSRPPKLSIVSGCWSVKQDPSPSSGHFHPDPQCAFPVPRDIGGALADGDPATLIFVVECFHVLHSDPDPGSGLTLFAAAEVDASSVARDMRELVGAPGRVLKSQQIHIKSKAVRNVGDAEDRLDAFKADAAAT
jgi:hypothetical protein